MENEEWVGAVDSAVHRTADPARRADDIWVRPITACADPGVHQLVMFLKPETTAVGAGVKFGPLFVAFREALAAHGVQVGAVRVVSGAFLRKSGVMSRHYGVINAVSCRGEAALSAQALLALRTECVDELAAGADILGGHQFLDEYPAFSAFALSVLFSNMGCTKLAPGVYVRAVQVEGRGILLLNGFHPYQLERFTRPGAVTVLMEGRTATPWKALRQDLAGATDPAQAVSGSFRRTLLDRQSEFGLPDVSQNVNGVHVSAGPLEAMVEVLRFFGPDGVQNSSETAYDSTCFGRLATQAGIATEDLARLAGNAVVSSDGTQVPVFDLTEEMDAAEAVAALRRAQLLPGPAAETT